MQRNLQAIILAAGKSRRLNTKKSKLTKKICGQEMVLYTTNLLSSLSIPISVVIGHEKESIKSIISTNHNNITFVIQNEQLGTGHAVLCTQDIWEKKYILILNGDAPLVTSDIISSLYENHVKKDAHLSFVTAHNIDPSLNSYGIVIHDDKGIKIIEAKENKHDRIEECCINAGIYLINKDLLEENIHILQKSNITGEIYITDLVNIASQKGCKIETTQAPFDLIRGINTLQELWACEQIKRAELIKIWMSKGIRFATPQDTHIDLNVTIQSGTCIGSGVQLYGSTKIGKNCNVEAFSILENATIEDNVIIESHTVIKNSLIKSNVIVGPFAYVHSNTVVCEKSNVGNFVDIKKSQIGSETKIKHLSYIGNSEIGNNVNIGAGTITCNSNGITKEKTIIQDKASIGSNNSLIAPINIGKDSFTAAGSVITKDVPADALAIARANQINKDEYTKKLKQPSLFEQKKLQKNSSSNLTG